MFDLPMEAILFYGFAALALAGSAGVLLAGDIVRMAVWLLATLASAAGLFFLLGATFVAAVQLIVYAGGTLVLIVFGVMLTSKDPRMKVRPRKGEVVAAGVACAVLAGLLIGMYRHTDWQQSLAAQRYLATPQPSVQAAPPLPADVQDRLTDLGGPLGAAANTDGTSNMGVQLLGTYLVPFEVVSLLLLAVLIGAAYLARPKVPAAYSHPAAPARVAEPASPAASASAPAPAAGAHPGEAELQETGRL